jgi:choline kinase
MKAVIFADGFGTRLSEETAVRPKPMVDIGDQPILWHITRPMGSTTSSFAADTKVRSLKNTSPHTATNDKNLSLL